MKFREETKKFITDKCNVIASEDAVTDLVNELEKLFRSWALEMVGEDERVEPILGSDNEPATKRQLSTNIQVQVRNNLRQEQRQRIEKVGK